MNPEEVVQIQLDAYNAHDLIAFVATYDNDVKLFRPPMPEPSIIGKAALADFYASKRFNLPNLHAEIINRIVIGNKVIDHERVLGISENSTEVAVIYEVVQGLIQNVWIFPKE